MTVFIQKGDAYLSVAQATRRGRAIYNLEMTLHERSAFQVMYPTEYEAWAMNWIGDNQTNTTNNQFNLYLKRYRKATQRLTKYVLSVGREAIYEDQETGKFNAEGVAITASMLIQTAIEPMEGTVAVMVYDATAGTSSEQIVPNPLIANDGAERAAAQSIVDATPDEAKAWQKN